MSEQNVALVQSLMDEWNRGGLEALSPLAPDFFHTDVQFLPLRAATEGAYRGLSGIEAFIADTLEVFDKFEFRYEYADLGELVLAWGSIHLRAKGSGLETDVETGGLFEFRDGKIVRWEDLGSKAKALEAAGLSE